MSVVKQTLKVSPEQTNKEDDKISKLNHLHHMLYRVHTELKHDAPKQLGDARKYDLVCRNVQEGLLILAYREKQEARMAKVAKKMKEAIKNL